MLRVLPDRDDGNLNWVQESTYHAETIKRPVVCVLAGANETREVMEQIRQGLAEIRT